MADSEILKIGEGRVVWQGGADLVDKLDEAHDITIEICLHDITKGLTPGDWIVYKYLFVTLFR